MAFTCHVSWWISSLQPGGSWLWEFLNYNLTCNTYTFTYYWTTFKWPCKTLWSPTSSSWFGGGVHIRIASVVAYWWISHGRFMVVFNRFSLPGDWIGLITGIKSKYINVLWISATILIMQKQCLCLFRKTCCKIWHKLHFHIQIYLQYLLRGRQLNPMAHRSRDKIAHILSPIFIPPSPLRFDETDRPSNYTFLSFIPHKASSCRHPSITSDNARFGSQVITKHSLHQPLAEVPLNMRLGGEWT